jgi:hypothetical protein
VAANDDKSDGEESAMGEAARKKAERAKWVATLDDKERTVVSVAERLLACLPPFGACYRASLFLQYHLEREHGIHGSAVIGYVNDGTDKLYGSHAWYQFRDKMTDIALCRPLRPEVQKSGSLVIHGRTISSGWTYSYHTVRPPEGLAMIEAFLADPRTAPSTAEYEALHRQMKLTATSQDLIRAYLDGADDGGTYDVLRSKL